MKPDFPVMTIETNDDGVDVYEDDTISEQVHTYAEKRDHIDTNEIAYTIVFEKGKNWQIVQDRYSGNTYLIVLKDK